MITKPELMQVLTATTDYPTAALALLVFKGAKIGKGIGYGEISLIRKSDFHDNYITIKGDHGRDLYFDDAEAAIIEDAIYDNDSPWLIPSQSSWIMKDTEDQDDILFASMTIELISRLSEFTPLVEYFGEDLIYQLRRSGFLHSLTFTTYTQGCFQEDANSPTNRGVFKQVLNDFGIDDQDSILK